MDVYWLEQTEADLPADNRWLSTGETLLLSGMQFPKRRTDWRLGRWTAKRALAARLDLPGDVRSLANIEIRNASSGEPEVFLLNQRADATISLSHRAGIALCTIALSASSLGCDLEMIEPHSDAFVTDYFTVREQELVVQASMEQRPLLMALIWSAKESALKALHVGLRLDTNCMDVSFGDRLPLPGGECGNDACPATPLSVEPETWSPLRIRYSGAQIFRGWWRRAGHMVRTVVSPLPLRPPVHLVLPTESLSSTG